MKSYKINQIDYKRIIGRNVVDAETKPELKLFWAASALEIKVNAKEVRAVIESDYEGQEIWISVHLNHSEISRIMVENTGEKNICLVRNIDPSIENVITIYKETQPMAGDKKHSLVIKEIILDDEGKFLPFGKEVSPLKIEFIGDSITSGEGLRGAPDQLEWISSLFSASRSYASQISRKFNCDFSSISQCGWGLRWGWDGNKDSNVPSLYNQVCSIAGAEEPYNFNFEDGKHPGYDYVVIALGTNDNSALNIPEKECSDSEESRRIFVEAAVDFLKEIKSKNPSAKILWTYGMIKLDIVPALIKQAVENYKQLTGNKDVWVLELDSMEDVEITDEDKGSRGHPGPKTHRLAAEKIIKFLQNL